MMWAGSCDPEPCIVTAQEKRIRARHSMQQLSKQMRDRQLKVQDRVKKQVSSVRNLPRVRRQTHHPPSMLPLVDAHVEK